MHLCRLDDGKCAGGGRTRQPSICCGDAGKGRDGRPIFDDSYRQTLCLSPQRLALNPLLFGENVRSSLRSAGLLGFKFQYNDSLTRSNVFLQSSVIFGQMISPSELPFFHQGLCDLSGLADTIKTIEIIHLVAP